MASPTSDELLAEAKRLSDELAAMPPNDPRRTTIEDHRAELRSQARELALERRHPVSIQNEITMLEARLDQIARMLIPKGYNEKHLGRTVQDPGAYSRVINRTIAEEHAEEVREIEARLALLRATLEPTPEDPPP